MNKSLKVISHEETIGNSNRQPLDLLKPKWAASGDVKRVKVGKHVYRPNQVVASNEIDKNPLILLHNFKYIAKREFEPKNKFLMVNIKQINASLYEEKLLVEPEISYIRQT